MALRDQLARLKKDPRWPVFRLFCEQSRRPSRDVSRLDAEVLSTLPRLAGLESGSTRTPDDWTRASREFVDGATRVLLRGLDRDQLRASPVWVVRQNNVHGEILDALVDRVRDSRGRRYGIEQIRKMKQAGIVELFEWALTAPEEEAGELPVAATAPSGRGPVRRWLVASAALLSVVAVLMVAVALRQNGVPDRTLDPARFLPLENRALPISELDRTLADLGIEAHDLPSLPFPAGGWRFVEPSEQHGVLVLFAASPTSMTPGAIALWDPRRSSISWSLDFVPAHDEIRTHATLEDEVYNSPFTAGVVLSGAALPGRIGVVYTNRFSPSFFLQVDLEDGAVLSRYVHPGRLESGLVADLDEDGVGEFVLAGQENVLQRPVVVVIGPGEGDGSASTVMWKDQPGEEDARVRAVLPGAPVLEEAYLLPRLRPEKLGRQDWSRATGILHVNVGGDGVGPVYCIDLDRRCEAAGIVIGEAAVRTWQAAGLDPDDALSMLSPMRVIQGRRAEAAGTTARLGANR